MRIAPISTGNIYTSPSFARGSAARLTLTQPRRDAFLKSEKEVQMPQDFGRRKFTIRDYNRLRGAQIRKILEGQPDAAEAAAKNVAMGIGLKKILDGKYGKDNYIFVSLGRSPAQIARVLEFSGVEVKYIPASNLNYPHCYGNSEIADYFNFVLSKQGLTKEKAAENFEKSGKKVVVCDYTQEGISLRKAEKVMHRAGYKSKFTDFISLNEELKNGPPELNQNQAVEKYIKVLGTLGGHEHKKFGGVSHAKMISYDERYDRCYDNLEELGYLVTNYVPGETASFYGLIVMHMLKKCGLLRENRANREAL